MKFYDDVVSYFSDPAHDLEYKVLFFIISPTKEYHVF